MAETMLRELWGWQDKCVRRQGIAATDLPGGANFNIFNIANGPIVVKTIFGVVTTIIGAGAAVPRIQFTPTGGAMTPLCAAAASIATDAVGTVYTVPNGATATALAPTAALGYADTAEAAFAGNFWLLVPGIITITNAVASTGVIDWYIVYTPADPMSFVTVL